MKTSSKVMLIASFCILVVLGASYYQLVSTSMPELTRQQANDILTDLSESFKLGKVSKIMAYAAPDARIGGRTKRQIESLLAHGMQYVKEPEVRFTDVIYTRDGEKVTLNMKVTVRDLSTKETLYASMVSMTLTRRATVYAGGLVTVYEWKVTNVDAPNIPSE